ncbi:MAG TPA: hypothetical protein VEA99_10420 [Gemmatimonadaceae bacterium]|nr:hypothetical protein [Gemmatimonadaceae bacterium]
MKRSPLLIALAVPLLWSCTDDQLTSVATTTATPVAGVARGLYAGFEVENRGAGYAAPSFPAFDQLPTLRILPDPFRSFDGSVDVSPGAWSMLRNQARASIEQWEIGPKPLPSDVDVAATYRNDSLIVVVTRKSNGKTVTLRSRLLIPAGITGPVPAVIGMNSSGGSIPADILTSRGIIRIAFNARDVTAYSFFGEGVHTNDPFYLMYPEYVTPGNHGQYASWSWGVSRLIDGMQIVASQPGSTFPIDPTHLAVTGCSYAGKMALFAGAFDERIALTIAQESGGGGMPAWRTSEILRDPRGDVERAANTNGAWFMRSMKAQFRGDSVYKFPHDHHQLMAMVAPRALLATNNYDFVWLSNPSAYISARATQAIYQGLGIADRFGFVIDAGHGHCAVPASQRPVIEAFVDKFLLGKEANTDVQVHPYPDLAYQQWMPWALRNDLAQFVTDGTLSADQAMGLRDKLEAALASIAAEKTTPALNQLKAFTNQVTAFVNAGAFTPEQGAALTARIDAIKAHIDP